jgi:hypothetical protein
LNNAFQQSNQSSYRRAGSTADPRRTAFVVHLERSGARRLLTVQPFPQCHQRCLKSLATLQLAFPVPLKSRSIAVLCRHEGQRTRDGGM